MAERIQSEYGGIIEASGDPLETDKISPVTEMSQTTSGCMDFEIPIENITTKNNSTLTDSTEAIMQLKKAHHQYKLILAPPSKYVA